MQKRRVESQLRVQPAITASPAGDVPGTNRSSAGREPPACNHQSIVSHDDELSHSEREFQFHGLSAASDPYYLPPAPMPTLY